jgi:hypothetical protein
MMRGKCYLMAAVPLIGAGLFSQGTYTKEVGLVREYSSQKNVSIRRAGKILNLLILEALLENDELILQEAQSRVVIQFFDEEMVTVCHPENRDQACQVREKYYRIHGHPSPTLAENVRRWMSDWLTMGHESLREVDASVRSGETELALQIPLLARPDARMSDGHKQFHLAWLGGRAPYSVHLRCPGDETPPFNLSAPSSRLVADVVLQPGNYAIDISDAAGESVKGRFRVIGAEEVPHFPEDVVGLDAQKEVANLYLSIWLASQQDGRWVLEAYQLASERLQNDPTGVLLLEMLASGRKPNRIE